jgi:general secretion pathway protein H
VIQAKAVMMPLIKGSSGFTLLELIVVLVIGGLIIAVVPPFISRALPGVEMKATAQNIAAALRYTRNRAVYQRQEKSLVIDSENKKYHVDGDMKDRKIPEAIELSLLSAETGEFGDNQSVYTFFPSGGSTGGRITLSRDDREYKIDVDWLTGRVRILD